MWGDRIDADSESQTKHGPTGQGGDLRQWLSELIKVFCASGSGASMMPV